LEARLSDSDKPAIDILHFDGHGVFTQVSEQDADNNPGLFGKSVHSEIQRERRVRREEGGEAVGIGFLVFENADRSKQLIAAEDLHKTLFQAKVGLVVLSACQSASLDRHGDPMASVAGRLTSTGIPAILAMTHAVLVATTRALFGRFYPSTTSRPSPPPPWPSCWTPRSAGANPPEPVEPAGPVEPVDHGYCSPAARRTSGTPGTASRAPASTAVSSYRAWARRPTPMTPWPGSASSASCRWPTST